MPTQDSDQQGVATAVKQVKEHAKALIGLELELAKLEITRKLGKFGLGIGLLGGAAVVGVMGLGFLFATLAAVLATFLPTWLALLVVTLFLLVVAGVLGLLGAKRLKPPVPNEAIREAKLTTAALKADGNA